MAKKEKTFVIKVPVYTTEISDNPKDLFGGVSYSDMASYIIRKLKSFQESKFVISSDNRNKTLKTAIEAIDFFEYKIGEIPSVLLKIKAYTTNLYDGYFETEDEKINFEKENRLGSENNFVLLYPVIDGVVNRTSHFLVLVYDDPHKRGDELLKTSKLVLKEVLNTPIRNLKLPSVLEELRKYPTIPELQVKYSAVRYDENLVDSKYEEYALDSGIFKKQKEDKFKNMPFEKVEDLLNDPLKDDYQKKEAKITVEKKEFKITKELLNEAQEEFKDTAEKVFNSKSEITEEQLQSIYETDFIIERLKPIIENYRE